MRAVVIGSPGDVRVEMFGRVLAAKGYPPTDVVSYPDLIERRRTLTDIVRTGTLVRIESPGKSDEANQALLALGEREPDEEYEYCRYDAKQPVPKGLIAASRQWYLGLRAFLRLVSTQLRECPPHILMSHPDDITVMFDKRLCHASLQRQGISVPSALSSIMTFDELETVMSAVAVRRVFIKLAHGSSASGVLAYQTNGSKHQATAAIEMVREKGEIRLYNTRRVHTYSDPAQIAALINVLCKHRVHIEQWIPKATMDGQAFDLRVVVIGGEAAHTVARLSHTPMTNLHLLNERRDREKVIEHLGKENFEKAMSLCRDAMACFPRSLYAGIDLLITPDFQRQYVLEMNAFGDLLHDTFYRGIDPYTMELEKVIQHAENHWYA
jgi:hypothetical protein